MSQSVAHEDRVRVSYWLLAGGATIAFLGFVNDWFFFSGAHSLLTLALVVVFLLMIPLLRRTRSLELTFGITAASGALVCLLLFALTLDLVHLAFGLVIPVAVLTCGGQRAGLVVSILYGLIAIGLAFACSQGWISSVVMQRGPFFDIFLGVLIMALLCGSSIFREQVIDASEAKRQLSEALLQQQLIGLRLLAETTTELLTAEPSEKRWSELLGKIASHLDCDVFTNYETQAGQLCLVASVGLPASVIDSYRLINFGEKVCGVCAEKQKPVYLSDLELAEHAQGTELYALGLRVVAVVPLIFGEKLVGTLAFASSRKREFANEELDFITTLGQSVASVRGRGLVEAQTRASEMRFRTIVDFASQSFFLIDSDHRFVDVNQQACYSLGYTREELLGMRVPEIEVSYSPQEIEELHKQILIAEETITENGVHRRKDGTEFPVETHLSHVSLDGADYVIALAINTSNRQQLADRVIQSQKLEAIGRLAGGVAHDFNNLLCVINSYAEILMEDSSLTETQRKWMRAIFEAGQRGAGLTRQMLVFGRKAVFEPKPIDLNDVVIDAQRLLERLIGENIVLEAKLSSSPCGILADRSQIDQVLVNLAVNARDSMFRGGTLTLQTKQVYADEVRKQEVREGEFIQLIVSDSGSGIEAELLTKIFDPFFTTKGVGEGTGLGLAVVYGIVKESGGWIDVTSEIGKGSTFTITLPASEISQPESIPQSAPILGEFNALILLVEDELAVRQVTSLSLEQQGYLVLEAKSSLHAIELAKQHTNAIHVLLTDVVMPELNGPEIVREIRSFLPNLPVLYMSGYSYDAIAQVTDLGEHYGLLKKPFSFLELSKGLHEALTKIKSFNETVAQK